MLVSFLAHGILNNGAQKKGAEENKMNQRTVVASAVGAIGFLLFFGGINPVQAAIVDDASISIIDSTDIIAFPDPEPSGLGEGTLNMVLFTFTGQNGSPVTNTEGSFNGDDANNDFPKGSEETASESYITSMGDIQDFYILEFPDGSGGSIVNQIVLFVDVNETGGIKQFNLEELSIVIDYSIPALDPASPTDIDSADQDSINDTWKAGDGTRIAKLDPADIPISINQVATGTGRVDQFILTGINPFDYDPSTRVLFYWNSASHENGGEDVFLSGDFAPCELIGGCGGGGNGGPIPEPSTLLLLGSGVGLLALRRRRTAIV